MRKISVVIIAFALLAAILGFMLRDAELRTAFERVSQLAITGAPMTTGLVALTVGVALTACVTGAIISKKYTAPDAPEKDAPAEPVTGEPLVIGENTVVSAVRGRVPIPIGRFAMIVSALGCIVWLSGSIAGFAGTRGAVVRGDYSHAVFFGLSALSAACVLYSAYCSYLRRNDRLARVLSIIPPIFFSYWLILLYREHASDPVIVRYGYECLAVASAAMSFYFFSGYLYGKSETGKTIFCVIMTVFLCGVIIADDLSLPQRAILASTLLIALANILPLTRWLVKKN